jgi:hypothetical protein
MTPESIEGFAVDGPALDWLLATLELGALEPADALEPACLS